MLEHCWIQHRSWLVAAAVGAVVVDVVDVDVVGVVGVDVVVGVVPSS